MREQIKTEFNSWTIFNFLDIYISLFNNFVCPGQTSTVVNGRIWRNTTKYMVPYHAQYISLSFTEKYGDIRRKNGRLRSLYTEFLYDLRFAPYFGVYDRISPYTSRQYTERNTGPCKTPKYDPLRSYTETYTIVYRHIRSP
jgi:hypothetical protein